MPFIDIKVIEGVFTAEEKREMVERVSEALIAVEGEGTASDARYANQAALTSAAPADDSETD